MGRYTSFKFYDICKFYYTSLLFLLLFCISILLPLPSLAAVPAADQKVITDNTNSIRDWVNGYIRWYNAGLSTQTESISSETVLQYFTPDAIWMNNDVVLANTTDGFIYVHFTADGKADRIVELDRTMGCH